MDSARHVMGCHSAQQSRVHNAFDDVASTINQSLPRQRRKLLGARRDLPPRRAALLVRQLFTRTRLDVAAQVEIESKA